MARRFLFLVMLASAGCGQPWRPPPAVANTDHPPDVPDLSAYLRPARFGTWAYDRRELTGREDEPPFQYPRRVSRRRMKEGGLLPRRLLPLDRYLPPPQTLASQPADTDRPSFPFHGTAGFIIRLGEPLAVIPADLTAGAPAVHETSVRWYYDGIVSGEGTLIRVAEIEGFEDVTCPAGTFERCLRVRVDLKISFPWGPIIDWTSYLWLSPEVGEVRRVQRVAGWYLIFFFRSTHELLLAEPPSPDSSPQPIDLDPGWSTIAILFDRMIPSPQIAGMVVDFAPASAPAP